MNTFCAKEKVPEGFRYSALIALIHNRKLRKLLIRLSLVLTVLGIGIGLLIQPKLGLLFSGGLWRVLLRFAAIAVLIALYMVAHEAVHGALMWLYSRKKPHFGFKMGCAYAGSQMYFGKNAYLSIALAPLVLWGAALTVISLMVPADWFWVLWGVQLTNLSGSAGDLYVFGRVLKKPDNVLVQDNGIVMHLHEHP